MHQPTPAPRLEILCGGCGARYADPGGDAAPWRCRARGAALSQEKAGC
jgi:hypothetical protein